MFNDLLSIGRQLKLIVEIILHSKAHFLFRRAYVARMWAANKITFRANTLRVDHFVRGHVKHVTLDWIESFRMNALTSIHFTYRLDPKRSAVRLCIAWISASSKGVTWFYGNLSASKPSRESGIVFLPFLLLLSGIMIHSDQLAETVYSRINGVAEFVGKTSVWFTMPLRMNRRTRSEKTLKYTARDLHYQRSLVLFSIIKFQERVAAHSASLILAAQHYLSQLNPVFSATLHDTVFRHTLNIRKQIQDQIWTVLF